MDGMQLRFIYVFTDLVLPLVLGYCLHQRKWINGTICNRLISFNIIVISTILSVLSFWVLPLTAELIWLPVFGVIFSLIPGAISYLTAARRYANFLERGSYMMSSMLSNIGTLGGLCAFILYQEIGFAYVQMVGLTQNVFLLLFCFPLAQYYYKRQESTAAGKKIHLDWIRMFFNWNQLPIAGMIIGMAFYLLDVPRPDILGGIFSSMVHIGAWLALIPVGYLIDFSAARHYYRKILDLLLIKFVLAPWIVYFITKTLFSNQILLGTMLILSTAPTAINAVVTARLFKLNVDLTIAAFILTTVIYLLAIFPAIFFFVTSGYTL